MDFIFGWAPIYKLFKSHVNYALMWISRILGPIKFCKGPIKISNGPLKFGNLHVFEWDMGHWPILSAHHHFGPGLTLAGFLFNDETGACRLVEVGGVLFFAAIDSPFTTC